MMERATRLWGQAGEPRRAAAERTRANLRALSVPLLVAAIIGSVLVTFALRAAFLNRSFEVFFDESIYLTISERTAHSLFISYDGHTPFFLHPPLFFLVQAGFLDIVRPQGNHIHHLYAARYVNVVFGSLSAALLFLICRRLAGWAAGLAAVVIFALEPFVVRINSRNLLETLAAFWVLLGLYVLLGQMQRWRGPVRAVGGGLAFGGALLTNEPAAMVTLLPLMICFATGRLLPRLHAALAAMSAIATYSVYPLFVVLDTRYWGEFEEQKLRGLRRFVGLLQESGFNAGHTISFHAAVLAHIDEFLSTYALMAYGGIAVVMLLIFGTRLARIAAVWTGCGYLLQTYSVFFGTNEEQYFYYLVVLAIITSAVGSAELCRRHWSGKALRRLLGARGTRMLAGILLLFTVLTGWSGHAWAERHLTPDNGYEGLFAFIEGNVPTGSRISATDSTEIAILRKYPYQIARAGTPDAVTRLRVQYVMVSTQLVRDQYSSATPELLRWLQQHGQLLHRFDGPTDGQLLFYKLPGVPDGLHLAPLPPPQVDLQTLGKDPNQPVTAALPAGQLQFAPPAASSTSSARPVSSGAPPAVVSAAPVPASVPVVTPPPTAAPTPSAAPPATPVPARSAPPTPAPPPVPTPPPPLPPPTLAPTSGGGPPPTP